MKKGKSLKGCIAAVLIETYWNVNIHQIRDRSDGLPVLIETYWNVNVGSHHETIRSKSVLIETYWNVNVRPTKSSRDEKGINRNILECK